MVKVNRSAAKFAFIDTLAATPINLFLNFVFISIAYKLEMSAVEAAPFLTAAFFFFALIRKYAIRDIMDRRILNAKKL